jgi:hypothetical protein
MKWETIKEKANIELREKIRNPLDKDAIAVLGLEAIQRLIDGKKADYHTLVKDVQSEVEKQINNIDVRNYKQLLAIAPKAFPACARNGKAIVELTDNGWEILPKPESV